VVSSSASGGGSPCDNSGDCATCSNCADATVCLTQGDDCYADIDCLIDLLCAQSCLDNACIQQCASDPFGGPLLIAYLNCLVCACANDCQAGPGCP
jgi:hypothetical protein